MSPRSLLTSSGRTWKAAIQQATSHQARDVLASQRTWPFSYRAMRNTRLQVTHSAAFLLHWGHSTSGRRLPGWGLQGIVRVMPPQPGQLAHSTRGEACPSPSTGGRAPGTTGPSHPESPTHHSRMTDSGSHTRGPREDGVFLPHPLAGSYWL